MNATTLPDPEKTGCSDTVTQKEITTERRHYSRFPASERALVAVCGDDLRLPHHLIDISEGGMAFRYLGEKPLPLTGSQLDLYLNEDLRVGRLPVTVVSDRRLAADGFIPKRRCGVRFGTLTSAQQLQLRDFIRSQDRTTPN